MLNYSVAELRHNTRFIWFGISMRRKTAASDRSDPQTHDAGNDGHAALLALPITDPYDITTPFDSVCGLTRRKGKGEEIDRKIARRKLSRVIPTRNPRV